MTILARYTFFNSGHRFSGLSRASLGVDEGPHVHHLAGGRA
jgi:preprotein translocase subunit SecD